MSEHIVKSFDEELERLRGAVQEMGGLAAEQLELSLRALLEPDPELAEQVVEADSEIDALEQRISQDAIRLLALRQPMAVDLRQAIAAIKIAFDLERSGDLAKNIALRLPVLKGFANRGTLETVARMGELAGWQLHDVLRAYSGTDPVLAREVWLRDRQIDDLYESNFRVYLTYMMEDPRTISAYTHLHFVAKNIERIGDHSTNIARSVYYLAEGVPLDEPRPKGADAKTAYVDPPAET
ncbi:MAG: phosphate signaling complex protein PhoU [Proteobacteria bacterium]|nr:phosphate signaling complex protein PhoU [Pseudomonadota bacterium]